MSTETSYTDKQKVEDLLQKMAEIVEIAKNYKTQPAMMSAAALTRIEEIAGMTIVKTTVVF